MRLGGWNLPLERLSATSLSMFITCPEQFRHKYLLNEQEKFSGERFMGSVQHEALRKLFDPQFVTDESRSAVDEAWQEIIGREGEPDWHDLDATKQYGIAQKMIETYWPIAQEAEGIVATEQRFEETIAGVEIVGYIDLELFDRVREVKTSSRKETKPKARWGFQGRLYSLVTQKPVEWHVVTRQVTPKVYTPADEGCESLYSFFNPDSTEQIVSHAVQRMSDLYTRHGKGEPWPMDGIFGDWACGYCSFKKSCPAWN